MADGGELIESVLMAIMGTALSVFMVRMGGETMDRLMTGLIRSGVYSVPTEWQHGFDAALINLFYVVCILPCLLGIVIGYLRTQKTTEVDVGQYITEGDYLQ